LFVGELLVDWRPSSAAWQPSVGVTKTYVDAPASTSLWSSGTESDGGRRCQSVMEACSLPPPPSQRRLDQRHCDVSTTCWVQSDRDEAADNDTTRVRLPDDVFDQCREDDAADDVLNWSELTIDRVARTVVNDLAACSQESNLTAPYVDSSTVENDFGISSLSQHSSLPRDGAQGDAAVEEKRQVCSVRQSPAVTSPATAAADSVLSAAMTTADTLDMLHPLNALQVCFIYFIRHLGSSTTADRQTYKHTHS